MAPGDHDPIRIAVALVAVALSGAIVLVVAGGGTLGAVIGFMLLAVPLVLLVSLVFYEVGRSEDRARIAERRRRRK